MPFETMFFERRNGLHFFDANHGSREKTAIWLDTFAGDERDMLQNLMMQKESVTKHHIKPMSASKTTNYGTFEVTNTRTAAATFEVHYPKPTADILSRIAQLHNITSADMDNVQQNYEQILHEMIEFILEDPQYYKRALDELHGFYQAPLIAKISELQKLIKYKPSYESINADTEDYVKKISPVLDLYLLDKSEKHAAMPPLLLDLYVLLIYQAMHPGIFDESLKEKFTRYLSYTVSFILQALVFTSLALLFMASMMISIATLSLMLIEFIFTAQIIGIFAVSTAIVAAEIWGLISLDAYLASNTEYKTTFSYISNHISDFCLSVSEQLFGCETFEFEITRTLGKGKALYAQEQDEPQSLVVASEEEPGAAREDAEADEQSAPSMRM